MARKINLNITDFRDFIKGGYLYVDKTSFIEHLENDGNTIFLFCRPRRMGKTLNLTMLKYFFDLKEDSGELFKGLHIESKNLLSYVCANIYSIYQVKPIILIDEVKAVYDELSTEIKM
ncbi:MAG: AAA family ATPase, partial [Prevotella sp.]|nr:AAA family ATPase [Prevotella sp.]